MHAHADLLIPFQHVNSQHWLVHHLFIKATKLSLRIKLSFFRKFILLHERKTRGWFFAFIQINETNTPIPNDYYFYAFIKPGSALYYFSLLRSKNISHRRATTRSHFNLYETQFCSSTKGVISFELMVRKKFRKRGAFFFLPDNTWKCRL